MMDAIVFYTHQFVKNLTKAGMPEAQAEIIANQQRDLIEERLATKRDMKALEVTLKRDMQELEMRLTRDFKIWTGSLAVALFVALTAIKYFG
ncbi:MAG: DUF1640 domain-containing protein [Alphaproteobacteria bacterium]